MMCFYFKRKLNNRISQSYMCALPNESKSVHIEVCIRKLGSIYQNRSKYVLKYFIIIFITYVRKQSINSKASVWCKVCLMILTYFPLIIFLVPSVTDEHDLEALDQTTKPNGQFILMETFDIDVASILH